jgi:hypothetical protein
MFGSTQTEATTMMTREEQRQLETTTIDAYSRDQYTSWSACIAVLANANMTQAEAQAVLMSKHMRWAADMSNKPAGKVTSSDLVRYMKDPRNAKWFTKKALADLMAGK